MDTPLPGCTRLATEQLWGCLLLQEQKQCPKWRKFSPLPQLGTAHLDWVTDQVASGVKHMAQALGRQPGLEDLQRSDTGLLQPTSSMAVWRRGTNSKENREAPQTAKPIFHCTMNLDAYRLLI